MDYYSVVGLYCILNRIKFLNILNQNICKIIYFKIMEYIKTPLDHQWTHGDCTKVKFNEKTISLSSNVLMENQ